MTDLPDAPALDLADTIPCRHCKHWAGSHLDSGECQHEDSLGVCPCPGYEAMTADEWEA